MENEQILPLGTLVYLEGGNTLLLIIGRGAIFTSEKTNSDVYTDYMAVEYPNGFNPEDAIFFNHEDIDKVAFMGYVNDEEERYLDVYREWEKNLEVPKMKN